MQQWETCEHGDGRLIIVRRSPSKVENHHPVLARKVEVKVTASFLTKSIRCDATRRDATRSKMIARLIFADMSLLEISTAV